MHECTRTCSSFSSADLGVKFFPPVSDTIREILFITNFSYRVLCGRSVDRCEAAIRKCELSEAKKYMQVLKRNQMESPVKLEVESVNVLLPLVQQL